MRSTPGGGQRLTRRSPAVAALWLLVAVGAGCAPPQPASPARPLRASAQRTLIFDNSGTEPVKLYLSERGSEWFIGHVLPGRTAALPLPATVADSPVGREFSLVIVPSSAPRSIRASGGAPSPVITSEAYSSHYLTAVRWKVSGRWLVALPDPAIP